MTAGPVLPLVPPGPLPDGAGPRQPLLRTVLRGVGQMLITLGVVVLLFCVYQLFFTGLYTDQQQRQLAADFERRVARPPAAAAAATAVEPPVEGQPFAVLRIPRLGQDYEQVVLEGVSPKDLRRGPGHYPGTALPGQVGNVVISGHRTTYGAPFADLDRLQAGDELVLQTERAEFVYVMTGSQVVAPSAVEVLAPVPNQPGQPARDRFLTLTTCNPKYSARERLIVFGRQVGMRTRSQTNNRI